MEGPMKMPQLDYARTQLAAVLVFAALCPLAAAEPAVDDMKAAAERKAKETATLQARIDELDATRKEAGKKQQYADYKRLGLELKAARSQLTAIQETTVEDFARIIVEERQEAEEAARMARQAKQDAERQAANEAALKREKQEKENERRELSGGCPLEIIGGNFFHSDRIFGRTRGRPGPCTVVKCIIVNRANAPVEAYELLIQFFDGFDRLISEHKLQGALLNPDAESDSLNALPLAETTKSMHIYIERTKMQDGTIWERRPEHKRTGAIWKKPEGAKFLD